MGENTPFTRKCTLEPSRTLERVMTGSLDQWLETTLLDHSERKNILFSTSETKQLDQLEQGLFGS